MLNIMKIMRELKIKSVKGYRFGNSVIQTETTGLALYHEKYGFLSFNSVDKKSGIKMPYINTRKVLKELLTMRLNINNPNEFQWVKPVAIDDYI